jgi:murein DD-endopeptidase MepM/ murein hydrolase activator NlpD
MRTNLNPLAKLCAIIPLSITLIAAMQLKASPESSTPSDTSCWDTTSGSNGSEAQEQRFQDGLQSFFSPDSLVIDTEGMASNQLKTGKFDYRQMTDTVRIVLADSAKNGFFASPITGTISSPFGARKCFWHFGTDILLRTGDTVRCAFDGIVRVAQYDRHGYGRVVIVRHADGLETLYGHLSKTSVAPLQRLKAGDMIGRGGNSGHSTGSHLHFEIRYRSEAIDPETIVDFGTGRLKTDTLPLSRNAFEYLTELRKTVYHTIHKGETLGRIARAYGTTVNKLCILNGIWGRTLLRVGRKIVIRKDDPPDADQQTAGSASRDSVPATF